MLQLARASGIVHRNMVGIRPSTTASIGGPSAAGGSHVRRTGQVRERLRDAVARLHLDRGASLRERRKRGEHTRAIGRSRVGRTTKMHALTDLHCRPCAIHLTPGQDADIAAASAVLASAPRMRALIADRATTATPSAPRSSGVARACYSQQIQQKVLHRFSKRAYEGRNVIERCFCRFNDFRRVATRYDKLARKFPRHRPPRSPSLPIGSIGSGPYGNEAEIVVRTGGPPNGQ